MKGLRNICMKPSLRIITIKKYHGINPMSMKLQKTIMKKIESDNGSKCMPKSVTLSFFLAKYPSSPSVIIAMIKIIRDDASTKINLTGEIFEDLIRMNSDKKTKPNIILEKVRIFAIFNIFVILSAGGKYAGNI